MKSKIKSSKVVFPDKVQYRINYSDELVDLIKKLLEKDRTKRLGSKNGAQDVLAHPWFTGIDRVKLENYQVEPPFKPVH